MVALKRLPGPCLYSVPFPTPERCYRVHRDHHRPNHDLTTTTPDVELTGGKGRATRLAECRKDVLDQQICPLDFSPSDDSAYRRRLLLGHQNR